MSLQQPCWQVVGAAQVELSAQAFTPHHWRHLVNLGYVMLEMTPQRSERRMLALILALVAIACLAFAGISKRWLYSPGQPPGVWGSERVAAPPYEVGFGLRETFACMPREVYESNPFPFVGDRPGERCLHLTNADALARERAHSGGSQISAAFVTLGRITFFASAAAALLLLISAALGVSRRRVVVPILPTTGSLLTLVVALISGCLFLAVKPGPPGYVGLGLGAIVFGGGVVAGIASSLLLGRLLRPAIPTAPNPSR
jgi:hypothetical protein